MGNALSDGDQGHPSFVDVLNSAAADSDPPIRMSDVLVICPVCEVRQSLIATRKTHPDDGGTAYSCRNGCTVLAGVDLPKDPLAGARYRLGEHVLDTPFGADIYPPGRSGVIHFGPARDT